MKLEQHDRFETIARLNSTIGAHILASTIYMYGMQCAAALNLRYIVPESVNVYITYRTERHQAEIRTICMRIWNMIIKIAQIGNNGQKQNNNKT